MAWDQTKEQQLEALKAAYAEGVRSVTFGDRTNVRYTEEEMARVIARLEAERARSTSPPRPKQFHAYPSGKGL